MRRCFKLSFEVRVGCRRKYFGRDVRLGYVGWLCFLVFVVVREVGRVISYFFS